MIFLIICSSLTSLSRRACRPQLLWLLPQIANLVMSAISGATIAVTRSNSGWTGLRTPTSAGLCVYSSNIPSLLALPRFSLLSRRWKCSCDNFNPPWLTLRKTNNPWKAHRSRRTTLLLTLRIRNMLFMLTKDTYSRVATPLSLALGTLRSGIVHLRVPPRTTISAAMTTRTSQAIIMI